MPDERGIVSKSKLTAIANKIKAAAGESGSFTLDELAALDISGGGGGGETITLSAVFDAGENKIFTTDTLDDLKQYLTVTATVDITPYVLADDSYTLSGSLAAGENTITVSALGKTTTVTVGGVITATDVTPPFSSFNDVSGTISTYNDGKLLVLTATNGTYRNTQSYVTLDSDTRYRFKFHCDYFDGTVRVGYRNSSNTFITGCYIPTIGESGDYVLDCLPSESDKYSQNALFTFMITYSTSSAGRAVFSNLKIIKYQEVAS